MSESTVLTKTKTMILFGLISFILLPMGGPESGTNDLAGVNWPTKVVARLLAGINLVMEAIKIK